ncbi:MAG: hypothetical protein LLF75_02715 [Eubacteriales bacterium]|nr:hypothetical protein [Eubacteriales bacterium]
MEQYEIREILKRFSDSGWELISVPASAYLSGEDCKDELIEAVKQADEECGSCGCEYDALYKRFLALSSTL